MVDNRIRVRKKLFQEVQAFLEEHEELRMDEKEMVHQALVEYMRNYEIGGKTSGSGPD
jgi:hypothetical protein